MPRRPGARRASRRCDAFASVSRVRRGGAEPLGDLVELFGDAHAHALRVAEQRLELGDLGLQLVALGLELDAAELGEAAQLQFEDVVGLQRAEVEHVHQACRAPAPRRRSRG